MKHILKSAKKWASSLFCILLLAGCSDYLDVVPDGIATLDNAFSNRTNAERFFFSCYNLIPDQNNPFTYPGNVGMDEIWWDIDVAALNARSGARIARNDQNAADPFQNYWDGRRDGRNLWIGIRDCNIFLENIDRVPDLTTYERVRWVSEVKFVKAYLHYFLLLMYGPIPIVDKNLNVDSPTEEVRVFREPVEEVIEYIVNLIDESMLNLPDYLEEPLTETGRITKSIAYAVKAKVLVWAASPLLNGNPDYADFIDKRGKQLIPSVEDRTKWNRAVEAIKEAIDRCHENGHHLYRFNGEGTMSANTMRSYTLRGAVTERPSMMNPEPVWSLPSYNNNRDQFQMYCTPKFYDSYGGTSELSATLKIAEQYYSKNGVPIDEDTEWDYAERYEIRRDTGTYHSDYIDPGETTAMLNYYREPRFYAHLAFDRSLFEYYTTAGSSTRVIQNRSGDNHGVVFSDCHIVTGYFIKKLVSFRTTTAPTNRLSSSYVIPVIRMSDLYLLYAEALNEVKDAPDNEVYQWVDSIRLRAGLEGVVDSWSKYSAIPGKPSTKEGMREIIKRERMIELAFEGQRHFDLRRWKDAITYCNQPVQGWDYQGVKTDEYYVIRDFLTNRNYTLKDYLWPLYSGTIIRNSNLLQNPGW
jgi:hypothetical protein